MDYTTIGGETVSAVKLLKEPYVGVTYFYGWVRPQPLEDGAMGLSFEYTLCDPVGYPFRDLIDSQEFTNYVGDVLASIIMNEQHKLESVTVKDSE